MEIDTRYGRRLSYTPENNSSFGYGYYENGVRAIYQERTQWIFTPRKNNSTRWEELLSFERRKWRYITPLEIWCEILNALTK